MLCVGPVNLRTRKLEVEAGRGLEHVIGDNLESFEPGLRVVDTRPLLGHATMDLVGIDSRGVLVLVALAFVGEDSLLLQALEGYSWCVDSPETVRRLYPDAVLLDGRAPRVLFVAERLPDAFLRKARHLGFPEIDCVEFRLIEVNGAQAVYFDLVQGSRNGSARTVPTAPAAPASASAPPRPSGDARMIRDARDAGARTAARGDRGEPVTVPTRALAGGEGPASQPLVVFSLPVAEPQPRAASVPKPAASLALPVGRSDANSQRPALPSPAAGLSRAPSTDAEEPDVVDDLDDDDDVDLDGPDDADLADDVDDAGTEPAPPTAVAAPAAAAQPAEIPAETGASASVERPVGAPEPIAAAAVTVEEEEAEAEEAAAAEEEEGEEDGAEEVATAVEEPAAVPAAVELLEEGGGPVVVDEPAGAETCLEPAEPAAVTELEAVGAEATTAVDAPEPMAPVEAADPGPPPGESRAEPVGEDGEGWQQILQEFGLKLPPDAGLSSAWRTFLRDMLRARGGEPPRVP